MHKGPLGKEKNNIETHKKVSVFNEETLLSCQKCLNALRPCLYWKKNLPDVSPLWACVALIFQNSPYSFLFLLLLSLSLLCRNDVAKNGKKDDFALLVHG